MLPVRVAIYTLHPVCFAGIDSAIRQFAPGSVELYHCADPQAIGDWRDSSGEPDVILIDVQNFVPYPLLAELRRDLPTAKVVLWVSKACAQVAKHAIDLGVRGILSKDADLPLMVRCLACVARGELWFDRKLTDQLLGSTSVRLSKREMQLLSLVTQGLSNKEIAHILNLTEGTVKHYFTRLFRKCGVGDRLELVFYGMRNLFGESVGGPWAMEELASGEWPRTLLLERTAIGYGA